MSQNDMFDRRDSSLAFCIGSPSSVVHSSIFGELVVGAIRRSKPFTDNFLLDLVVLLLREILQ